MYAKDQEREISAAFELFFATSVLSSHPHGKGLFIISLYWVEILSLTRCALFTKGKKPRISIFVVRLKLDLFSCQAAMSGGNKKTPFMFGDAHLSFELLLIEFFSFRIRILLSWDADPRTESLYIRGQFQPNHEEAFSHENGAIVQKCFLWDQGEWVCVCFELGFSKKKCRFWWKVLAKTAQQICRMSLLLFQFPTLFACSRHPPHAWLQGWKDLFAKIFPFPQKVLTQESFWTSVFFSISADNVQMLNGHHFFAPKSIFGTRYFCLFLDVLCHFVRKITANAFCSWWVCWPPPLEGRTRPFDRRTFDRWVSAPTWNVNTDNTVP